jgi:hypothetical protein
MGNCMTPAPPRSSGGASSSTPAPAPRNEPVVETKAITATQKEPKEVKEPKDTPKKKKGKGGNKRKSGSAEAKKKKPTKAEADKTEPEINPEEMEFEVPSKKLDDARTLRATPVTEAMKEKEIKKEDKKEEPVKVAPKPVEKTVNDSEVDFSIHGK